MRSTTSVAAITQSSLDSSSPMAILHSQPELHGQSVIELSTIGKSSSHLNSSSISSTNSLNYSTASSGSKSDTRSTKSSKTPPTTPPVGGKPSSTSTRSVSPHPKSNTSLAVVPSKNEIPEKEKKRKELSSSRQKKFYRHFQQVSKNEKLLNYFSCALVSDILLQGHLYITENYLAFYSNVFGFVTKLLIPTSAVIRISKEKTAKIIPNAVGVATNDERHVFGSFMSREAAFRLMSSVCPSPCDPSLNGQIIKLIPELEISEECSIEDDSSCSISGNESPPQLLDLTSNTSDASQTILRHRTVVKSTNQLRTSVISNVVDSPCMQIETESNRISQNFPIDAKVLILAPCSSTPKRIPQKNLETVHQNGNFEKLQHTHSAHHQKTNPMSEPKSQSSSLSFKTFTDYNIIPRLKFPTDFHIVYLGVFLSIILALFSGFLLYRILDIEAKTTLYRSPIDFNWGSGNDADIFAEALKWQRELQAKSTKEAQNILNTNLQQIAKVRKSLETLSMLIHDRSSSDSSSSFSSAGERDDTD